MLTWKPPSGPLADVTTAVDDPVPRHVVSPGRQRGEREAAEDPVDLEAQKHTADDEPDLKRREYDVEGRLLYEALTAVESALLQLSAQQTKIIKDNDLRAPVRT